MAQTELITLRKAEPADSEAIYAWRNHEKTREFFLDPRPIERKTHDVWFSRTLADAKKLLLIGEVDERPIGVIRYDLQDDHTAEVSIYLVPGEHGKGYGARLLQAGSQELKQRFPAIRRIYVLVLADNQASHHVFQKVGFKPYSTAYRLDLETGSIE